MAQHDYVISNQSFPSTRTDINNALLAISSTNSGATAPSTTYANQLWYDTSENKLYIRNEDNDAWIPLFLLDQSNDVAGTLATEIDVEDASGTDTAGTALTIKGGAGTGAGAGGSIVFQTADGGSSGSSVNSHATRVTITDDGTVQVDNDLSIADKIIHTGDTNTAIRFPAADTISFETAGSERLRIDSSGIVKLITANDTAGTSKSLTFGTNAFNRAEIRVTNAATFDGSLEFYTGNASNFQERMRIQPGGGISFNGDTAAANALSDYEEGTWTPTYIGSVSNPTVTYDTQTGFYRKIGKMVLAQFVLKTDAFTGGSGSLFVAGLPFAGATSAGMFYSGTIGYSAGWTLASPQTLHIGSAGQIFVLTTNASTNGQSNLSGVIGIGNAVNAANSNFILGAITYPTDS